MSGGRGAALGRGPVFAGGDDEAVAAAAPQLVVGVQLVQVVAGAQVRHALVVHVLGVARLGRRGLGLGAGGHALGGGPPGQGGHAGVARVPGRRRQLLRVLVGEQREEALAVVLGDPPSRVMVRLVVLRRVNARGQQRGVGLLVDELQAQALLVAEGGGVVQDDGVLFAPPAAAAAQVVHQLVHQIPVLLAGALVVVQVGRDVVGGEFLQDLFL